MGVKRGAEAIERLWDGRRAVPLQSIDAMVAVFAMAFVTGLSGALMPGPVLTLTMAEAAKRGARAGPLIVFGHGLLELALVCALVVGLGKVLRLPLVFAIVGIAGGIALIAMAGSMIWSRAALPDAPTAGGPRQSFLRPAGMGAGVSLANPYWSLWWATAGARILAQAVPFGAAGVAVFFGGHILADLSWYTLVAIGVSSGRRFLTPVSYRALVIACGLALGGLGLWFLWSGARRLLG